MRLARPALATLAALLVGCTGTPTGTVPPPSRAKGPSMAATPTDRSLPGEHPRLFFTPREQARLRALRDVGGHKRIWANIKASADWCLTLGVREKWIAPITPDPIYENLYERFYGMMRDMAVAEHLAFAYALAPDGPDRDRYFDGAKRWALALARVWIREADGAADASKAYAATRVLKGMAIAYDLTYDRLTEPERKELREALVTVGRKYFDFFKDPNTHFGGEYEPHHGSVEAASMGLVALALAHDAPEADAWVDFFVERHVNWLFPHALTPSGTHNQTSNFWISIMQYRMAFMDAMRRVRGRDLFSEFEKQMPLTTPMACAVWSDSAPVEGGFAQTNQTWLVGPSYGQIDYAAPALVGLAREYRRGDLQHLAEWDPSLGGVQRSRYICRGEQMLFGWGGYAYAWYDESVAPQATPGDGGRLSWLFEDPNPEPVIYMNEAYARASLEPRTLAAAVRRGAMVIHAGGRAVLNDFTPNWPPLAPVKDLAIADDGAVAVISCTGVAESGFTELKLALRRPSTLLIERASGQPWRWWSFPGARVEGQTLRWPDGTTLRVVHGQIASHEPKGYTEDKVTGMGKLPLVDPLPTTYPVTTVAPSEGRVVVEVRVP
ncbi:MAG: DUF4962 domain-containing protein [Planctomycetota bacterium]|nr:DUF4962 domain-containing protein [Planctomycetota bacterium]